MKMAGTKTPRGNQPPSGSSPENTNQSKQRILLLVGVLILLAVVMLFQQGIAFQRQQWLQTASLEELVRAAEQEPDSIEIARRLGTVALEKGDAVRAAQALERAAQLSPDHEDTWLKWARAAGETRGALAAEAVLTAYLKDHPQSANTHLELALLYAAGEDFARAEKSAQEATRLAPKMVEAWRMWGQAALSARRFPEAIAAFQEACRLAPQDWRPAIGLARSQIEGKQYSNAVTSAEKAVALAPTEPEAHLALGRARFETAQSPTDFDAARQHLKQSLTGNNPVSGPRRLEALRYLGESHVRQSQWQEALPWLEEAARLAPGSVEVQFALVRVYRGVGDTIKAEEALKRQKILDQYQTEIRELSARIAERPQEGELQLRLARLYASFGNFVDAVKIYRAMIARNLSTEIAERELRELSQKYAPNSPKGQLSP
jgi:tetratricopeptide (TPR) repeat protein